MTPISRILEIGLAVSGIAILYFMARIFVSKHAWGDGAQYEMLDLPTPDRENFEALDARGQVHAATTLAATDAHVAVDIRGEESDYAAERGLIGLEDRIVRFGFTLALTYISITWFGIRSMAMWLLALPVLYLLITAFVGRDPIYKMFGLTTEFD